MKVVQQNQDRLDLTSVEFLIGAAVHVFDWAVGFQRLQQHGEPFRLDSLLKDTPSVRALLNVFTLLP